MDLSIIIINYKTKKITADCLETITKSRDNLTKEVIVVDNGSADGSFESLKAKFPQYHVLSSGGNLGFARGNNFGVDHAKGEYIWLLNSDTLIKPNTISTLMECVKSHDSQLASCQLLNPDGSIQPQGGYLPDLWRLALWMLFIDDLPLIKSLIKPYHQNLKSFFQTDQYPGWLAGTALLIRRDVYEKLNGLDKNIFMYGEDVEFCLRAKQQGVRIDYFCQPQLTHLGQASGSSRGAILGEYQGLIYIYKKYFNCYQQLILKILLKLGAILRIIILRNRIYAEAFRLA